MEPAERLFVVLAGRVKLYKLSPRGDEQILHMYGPGNAFAEAAVLAGGKYPAFAEAAEDCTLLAIDRRELRRAIRTPVHAPGLSVAAAVVVALSEACVGPHAESVVAFS